MLLKSGDGVSLWPPSPARATVLLVHSTGPRPQARRVGALALVACRHDRPSRSALTSSGTPSTSSYTNRCSAPRRALGAIQRSFQGDRARVIQYNVADAETRAPRTNLAERQTDLQALLAEYSRPGRRTTPPGRRSRPSSRVLRHGRDGSSSPSADVEATWSRLGAGLPERRSADGDRRPRSSSHGFNRRSPSRAVMEPYAAERVQAAAAAAEADAGQDLASVVRTQIDQPGASASSSRRPSPSWWCGCSPARSARSAGPWRPWRAAT